MGKQMATAPIEFLKMKGQGDVSGTVLIAGGQLLFQIRLKAAPAKKAVLI
jgi:hypothetical protein